MAFKYTSSWTHEKANYLDIYLVRWVFRSLSNMPKASKSVDALNHFRLSHRTDHTLSKPASLQQPKQTKVQYLPSTTSRLLPWDTSRSPPSDICHHGTSRCEKRYRLCRLLADRPSVHPSAPIAADTSVRSCARTAIQCPQRTLHLHESSSYLCCVLAPTHSDRIFCG